MNYHAENMDDAQKKSFNHSIQDPSNSEALMVGLQAMYERSLGVEKPQTDRVRGDVAQNNAIKPYETKADLMRDKSFADSKMASASDKARFRARLRLTNDNVWIS